MKKFELNEMEKLEGGSARLSGCALTGLAAGIATGLNPLVGGLTTATRFIKLENHE